MFSIYSSAFNLIKNQFDYQRFLDKAFPFASEIVIAVNSSEDGTIEALRGESVRNPSLKIVETNFSYNDPLLDGKVKNEALQSTTRDFKIGLDLDEYIPLWQKPIWEDLVSSLRFNSEAKAYMIPSVNLYQSEDLYSSITPKWYLHKAGLYRGAVAFARNPDGTVDTKRSDTCELIDENGNLAPVLFTNPDIGVLRTKIAPFVVHTGYESLEKRVLRNVNFWQKHWRVESGGKDPNHKVHTKIEEFTQIGRPHGLNL